MKKLPASAQTALYWSIALGLHGLVLMVPIAPSEPPVSEKAVGVVQLPKPVAQPPAPRVQPSLPVPAAPKPQTAPKQVASQSKAIAAKPPALAVKPSQSPASSSTSPPAQSDPDLSASPVPSPIASPTPSLSPSPIPSPDTNTMLADFAKTAGAQPGCSGKTDCWQIAQTNGRLVAQDVKQHLEQKGYTVTKLELNDDTGMEVAEVAKNRSVEYYLHLLWTDQGTVYFLHDTRLSRAELEQRAGI